MIIKLGCIFFSENRYLLFLTENYAALDILEHYLEVGSGEDSPSEEDSDSVVPSKPFILFGSSFPKDKDYTQVSRDRLVYSK